MRLGRRMQEWYGTQGKLSILSIRDHSEHSGALGRPHMHGRTLGTPWYQRSHHTAHMELMLDSTCPMRHMHACAQATPCRCPS